MHPMHAGEKKLEGSGYRRVPTVGLGMFSLPPPNIQSFVLHGHCNLG